MWKPGMRVHDLFPDKESLVTRDYWLKYSQLGQPTLTYIPTCLPNTPYGVPNLRYGIPAGEGGDDPIWSYSAIRSPNLIGEAFGTQGGKSLNGANTNSGEGLETDGGLDCAGQGEASNLITSSNERVGTSSSQSSQNNQSNQSTGPNGLLQQQRQQPYIGAGATRTSTANASVSGSTGRFLPRNDVKLNEPDIDWSYAVIERQNKENLQTTLVSFNLGQVVLQGDASQNLELEPGDVVTIFSTADIHVPQSQQTKFVRLEGEFASAGIYSVRQGETLRQLVQRAGGLTSDAYLFVPSLPVSQRAGFSSSASWHMSTRSSCRRVQTQPMGRGAPSTRKTLPQPPRPRFRTRISSIVCGRCSLQDELFWICRPDAHDVAQLPDIPLENGDSFIVPRVP